MFPALADLMVPVPVPQQALVQAPAQSLARTRWKMYQDSLKQQQEYFISS